MCKPSELTPLTANALSEVMSDVGIPSGVVNIVHGFGAEAGQPLYVFLRTLSSFSPKSTKSNVSASAILV